MYTLLGNLKYSIFITSSYKYIECTVPANGTVVLVDLGQNMDVLVDFFIYLSWLTLDNVKCGFNYGWLFELINVLLEMNECVFIVI